MSVSVVSKIPAGGRCTLYTRYAEVLAGHGGLAMKPYCPGDTAEGSPSAPALVIRGTAVEPADGVIVTPEDIGRVLAGIGFGPARLQACGMELEAVLEAFMEEWS